jgi:deoxycytidine triphosphate deaminase
MLLLKVTLILEMVRRIARLWKRAQSEKMHPNDKATYGEQPMLLNDQEIRTYGLIEDYADDKEHFRAASYDIRIGTIITVKGKEVKEMRLKPQGIVEVVSREKVSLPMKVGGFAMVKTSLCNQGILPLNIGIIDPGYNGYLSTTLLNFGKKEFRLKTDQVFLRISFIECHPSPNHEPSTTITKEQYIDDKKDKVMNFSDTFLNIAGNVDELFRNARNRAISVVVLFGFMLTAFSFLVTLGVNYTARNVWSRDQLKSELLNDIQQKKQADLEQRIKELEKQMGNASNTNQGNASNPNQGNASNTNQASPTP